MDKLSLLQQFVVAVEQGGFAAAAKHLGLSPSTLSKSMARLEQHLNIKLFHRSTRQVSLTEAGSRYLISARNIIEELEQCELQLKQSNEEPKGRVKVSLPVSYGRTYVMPSLHRFIKRYPDIQLDLSFNDSYVDIMEQGIDLCVRSGTLEDRRLVARKLSTIDFLICASPGYIENNGYPLTTAQFTEHPWIRFRYRQTGRLHPVLVPDGDIGQPCDPGRQFIVDDGEALADLCAQGLGLTQVPHFIARNWLNNGRIVPIRPYFRSEKYGVYLIYPKREFLPTKVRVLIDFLVAETEAADESAFHTWAEKLSIYSGKK
ncbi:LysR family transcriptional regulator [Motiliproteus sp. MSK22-1]|uniref:LysR family transcriptional regulator n=1 Tax=Motiliproteus sp. MSK22-1 TaxID=1897630 RepID=UPI000977B8AE|nr:LysR family transcriptional regulator [Motiliproteus sp. MSK22-1]OMH34004.1 transcriptional regulator [Motiliproteus sp. MSK22-1]